MPTTINPELDSSSSIERLNALLRGELSAVETYGEIINKFGEEAPVELNECLRSHRQRVTKLGGRIVDLGGTPSASSGLWGSFARLVEKGAALFGRQNALAALEEGEDHGLAQYREYLDDHDLDVDSRRLFEAELMPEQLKTHDMVRNLCRSCT